jgi:glycosyltransferase 2 family protein
MIKSLRKFWLETPYLRWWLRLIVAGSMLWLLFNQVDVRSVWRVLKQADIVFFIPMLALYFLARYLIACQILLASTAIGEHLHVGALLKIQLTMSFYSMVLPGEILAGGVGWYKLAKINRKMIESGALLIYLRLINIAILLLMGLIGFGFDPYLDHWAWDLSGGLMLSVIILAISPFVSQKVNSGLFKLMLSASEKLSLSETTLQKIERVWDTTKFFNDLRYTNFLLVGISVLVEVLHTLIYFLIARSVGIDLPVIILAWIRSAITIVQMVPVSIAGLGVREISLVWMLNRYGIPDTKALGFSLLILAYLMCTGFIGGIVEALDVIRGKHKNE